MNFKAATQTKNLKIGNEAIQIEVVKGQPYLYRISINNAFIGYIEDVNGELKKVDILNIHDLIFARICHHIKN